MAISNNMGSALGAGFSSGLNTFMAQLPGILQAYNKESRVKKGQSILDEFDANNPADELSRPKILDEDPIEGRKVNPFDSKDPRTDPAVKTNQPTESAGSALGEVAGKPGEKSVADPKATNFASWLESTATQESRGQPRNGYGAVGPTTKHGEALGRYQIVPKFHFHKIGLDPKNRKHINQFLNNDAMQDELAQIVGKESWDAAGGDPVKASLHYYTGSTEPSNIDTIPLGPLGTPIGPAPRVYAEEVGNRMGSQPVVDTAANSMAESTVKKQSALTNVESAGAAADTLNSLLKDVGKDRPKYEEGRASKKLKYFYENASPEVIEAMEPMIKKLEGMSDDEKTKYAIKLESWEKDADRKIQIGIAKAKLAGTLAYKEATRVDKSATGKRAAAIKELQQLSKNYQNQLNAWDKKIRESKIGTKAQQRAFKLANPDMFTEVVEEIPFWPDSKSWHVNNMVRDGIQKEIDGINERLKQLEGGMNFPSLMESSGGQSGTPDLNNYFSSAE